LHVTQPGFALGVVAGLVLLGWPGAAPACICTTTLPEAIDLAEEIYSGKVLSVTLVITDYGDQWDRVLVLVEDRWRGAVADTAIVYEQPSTSCSIRFEVGEEYVVLARTWHGELFTGFCHRTDLLRDAEKVLDALGDPVVPTRDVDWSRLKSTFGG
jgi:hypothetical protein